MWDKKKRPMELKWKRAFRRPVYMKLWNVRLYNVEHNKIENGENNWVELLWSWVESPLLFGWVRKIKLEYITKSFLAWQTRLLYVWFFTEIEPDWTLMFSVHLECSLPNWSCKEAWALRFTVWKGQHYLVKQKFSQVDRS